MTSLTEQSEGGSSQLKADHLWESGSSSPWSKHCLCFPSILSLLHTTLWAGFILTLTRVTVRQSPHKLPCLLKADYNIRIDILLTLNITEKESQESIEFQM